MGERSAEWVKRRIHIDTSGMPTRDVELLAGARAIHVGAVSVLRDETVECEGPLGAASITCEDVPRAIYRVVTHCDNYTLHNHNGRLLDECIKLARMGYRFVRVVNEAERDRVEAEACAEISARLRRWPGADDPVVVCDD